MAVDSVLLKPSDIADYEKYFRDIVCNIDQYVNPVKEMATQRAALGYNREAIAQLDEMERTVLNEPAVQERIKEQATDRGAFLIYDFLEEIGARHDIHYPIDEWKKESTFAYVQSVTADIEASRGNFEKMTFAITAVTNMMDAVDAQTIAEQMDLNKFWRECGYLSAQADLNDPQQAEFVHVLNKEYNSPDLGQKIAPHIDAGKALYAYEHRHESFEHMVLAAEKVFESVEFDGLDFAQQYFDIALLAREAGAVLAQMEIQDLQQNAPINQPDIAQLTSYMIWDAQYESIGRHMAQARAETIEAHPEVVLDNRGNAIDAPYNPLVLKSKEIEQIVHNLEQRGETHVDESRAIRDYAVAFTHVLDNLEQYKSMPTDDFHVMTTDRAVNVIALLKHHYQDNPEMLQTFASLERQAYQDPERQQEIAEKASRASGYWIQDCMKGFGQAHQITIPTDQWEQAADLDYVQSVNLKFQNNKNQIQVMTQMLYEVPQMLDTVGKDRAKENMDLDEFWQACGKLAADATIRVNERESDEMGYYNIPAYSTREEDMRFLTALSHAEKNVDFYYIHNNIEQGVAERQEQLAEKAQRLEEGLNSQTITAQETLDILYEIAPSEIEKRGLGTLVQEFWTEQAKESYRLQDAQDYHKANDLIEILNQVEFSFPELGETINAAYEAAQQEKETEQNLYDIQRR